MKFIACEFLGIMKTDFFLVDWDVEKRKVVSPRRKRIP